MNITNDGLIQAYKKEKNNRKKERLHAICMIKINEHTIAETAKEMFYTYQCVRNWLDRFEEFGLNGLEDLPRSGRSPLIPHKITKDRKIIQKTFRRHDSKETNAVHI